MDINELIKKATEGDAQAQYQLGIHYYEEQKYKETVDWLTKASEQGHAAAQCILAVCYEDGEIVEKDSQKAIELYKSSAEQGYMHAQFFLADCYESGTGVEQDYKKAFLWYEKAANQGCDMAQEGLADCYYYGRGTEQNHKEAVIWYERAAEKGHYLAQCKLGKRYFNGEGVEQDYEKAFEWYKKAAEQGYDLAIYHVGKCYFKGYGVKKDYKKAVEWYEKSAEQGYDLAQYELGECYFNGYGVEKDLQKGFAWYEKAMSDGWEAAIYDVAECYFYGKGVTQNYQKAKELLAKSAEKNWLPSQFALGWRLAYGYGFEKDYRQAVYWLSKAEEQGQEEAKKLKEEILALLNGEADERYNIANAGKRYDIFISWNHNDKDFKDLLVEGIENFDFDDTNTRDEKAYAHYRAWESDRDADGFIDECIKNAINKSKYFILLLSKNALKSKWVAKEVEYALDRIKRKEWTEENIIVVYLGDDVTKSFEKLDNDSPFLKLRNIVASFKNDCEINAQDKRLIKTICDRIKNGLEAEAIKNYIRQQTEENKTFKASIKNQFDNNGHTMSLEEENKVSFIDAYLEYEKGYVERELLGANKNASVEDIATSKSSVYIYGAGGTGKSLYISNLIKKYFNKDRFFIRVNLIDYEKTLQEKNSLTSLLNDELNRYLTDNDEYRSVKAIIRAEGQNNKMTVVLDGLDEISKGAREHLLSLVSDFKKQNKPLYRFIFVARSRDYYNDIKGTTSGLEMYTLSEFGRKEQEKLYDALNEKTKALYGEERGRVLKESFFEMIDTLGEEISKNPFLLSNLIFIYLKSKGQEYPKNKLSLVSSATEMFIKDIDEKKHIFFEYPEYMVKGEIRKALEYIAFKRQLGNGHSFKELLIDYFNTECKLRAGHEAELVGVSVYNYLYRRNIITESKITHDIFTAYFASCYLYGKIYERVQLFFDDAIVFNSNDGKKYFESAMRRLGNEDGMWREIASELIMKLDSEIYALDKNQKMNESNPSYEAFDYTLTKVFTEKGFSKGAIDIVNEMCQKQFGFYFGEFIKSYI